MLNARVFIYVEPLYGSEKKVKYVSDTSGEPVICNMDDLFMALKREYSFKVDQTEDIRQRLVTGSILVLDLEKKEIFKFDDNATVVLRQRVIRDNRPGLNSEFQEFNRYVEKLVANKLFTK